MDFKHLQSEQKMEKELRNKKGWRNRIGAVLTLLLRYLQIWEEPGITVIRFTFQTAINMMAIGLRQS